MKLNIKDILSSVYKQYLEFTSENTLMIDAFLTDDDECIYINRVNKELYCLELSGNSNIPSAITMQTLENLYENYQYSDSSLLLTFLKKDIFQKVYLFSSDKQLLQLIKSDVGGVILKNYDVLSAVYYLFMDTNFCKKDNVLLSDFDISKSIDYENISNSFNKIVKDAVYSNIVDYDVYQAVDFKNRVGLFEQQKLFKINWEGVIFVDIHFSKDINSAVINQRKNQAIMEAKQDEFKKLEEGYNNSEIKLVVLNSILVLKSKDRADVGNLVSLIGNALSIAFKKKIRFKDMLLKYTLLKKRDTEWDMLKDLAWLDGFIQNNHKLNFTDKSKAMFSGSDVNGAFVNFHFADTTPLKTNKNSDFLLLGVKGSGKTTSTNAIMSQIVGIDLKTKQFEPINLNKGLVETRIFDIKNSSRALYELIKDKSGVGFLDTALENFTYNPINIPYQIINNRVILNENILEMNILLLSITLEVKNKSNLSEAGFSNSEQTIIRDIIRELYSEFEKGDMNTVAIQTLEDTHEKVYNELKTLGYNDVDRVGTVKEHGYDFLKVPTLDMVINKVALLKQSDMDKIRKRNSETLYSKLDDIKSINIFNGFDKLDVEQIKYLYMNFDPIKDIPEFVPIFLAMATKLFLFDKLNQRDREAKGIERPYIIYLFEEAVNLFRQPSFENFLIKFNNEARSDRIVAGYVAQVIEQVPKYIFDQVENKLLLFPSEGKRNQIIDAITNATNPNQNTIDVFRKVGEFEMCFWNEHGATVVNLRLTKEEIDVFGQDK